ncbi:MAG: histidine kinase [Planctomycetaceae bacterium]|nr:histidine kinase [Planctomycetaceae bacterium]
MTTTENSMHTEMPVIHGRGDLAELRSKFYTHLIVYLCVNVGLFALNFTRNPDHMWCAWVAFGWGIGIVCHAVKVFWFEANRK